MTDEWSCWRGTTRREGPCYLPTLMAPDLCEYLTRTIRNHYAYAESQGVGGAKAKIMDQR